MPFEAPNHGFRLPATAREQSINMILLALVLSLTAAACSSSDPTDGEMPGLTSITGMWRGSVTSFDTVIVPVEMEIMEDMRVLTGSGTVESPTGTFTFTIDPSSSYFHPLVNIFLQYGRPPLGKLDGIVSEDRMNIRGTMTGPGFSGLGEFEMVKVE